MLSRPLLQILEKLSYFDEIIKNKENSWNFEQDVAKLMKHLFIRIIISRRFSYGSNSI